MKLHLVSRRVTTILRCGKDISFLIKYKRISFLALNVHLMLTKFFPRLLKKQHFKQPFWIMHELISSAVKLAESLFVVMVETRLFWWW